MDTLVVTVTARSVASYSSVPFTVRLFMVIGVVLMSTVVPAPMTTSSVDTGTPVSHVAGLFHRPVATLVTVAAKAAGVFAASASMLASANPALSLLRRGIVFIALLRVVRVESLSPKLRTGDREDSVITAPELHRAGRSAPSPSAHGIRPRSSWRSRDGSCL